MNWSLRAGTVAGIPIRLHITFLFVVTLIGTAHWLKGGTHALAAALVLVAGLFGSVLLHELGHALAARRYGIRTRDIVLLPIGGVARLESMPEQPSREIVVALAGPAVNVVIAGALFAWLAVSGTFEPLASLGLASGSLVERLMATNLGLAAFNLLPVFPLDGGRVLRALLATRLTYLAATQGAARVGQAGAVLLGAYGLFANPLLVLIAVFVWMAAGEEARVAAWRAAAREATWPAGHGLPRGRGWRMAPGVEEVVVIRIARRPLPRSMFVVLLALVLGGLSVAPAAAQYFGQNKVRHKAHEFKVLETAHFDLHYYDEKRDAAVHVGRLAERWHDHLSRVFGAPLSSRQAIVLYASHADFRGTTVVPGDIGETTGGLTEGIKRRIVMPLSGPMFEVDHVLGHELVHAFQFDLVKRLEKQGASLGAALSLPLWFVEGLAEHLSIGPIDAATAMFVRDALRREALPDLATLGDERRYFPYRWGHAFWAYVDQRYGRQSVPTLFAAALVRGSIDQAVTAVLKTEPATVGREWQVWLRKQHPAGSGDASPGLEPLLAGTESKARLNLGPALSPDGRFVAFYSERDGTAVDLFLADAHNGVVLRKLTELAVSPHTDSLGFVASAGAWTADGRQLAFPTVTLGRPELAIYDVAAERVTRRVPLGSLGDVLAASWSPDGRSLVLSASAGGYVDLVILEVASGTVRRLTDDPFAELHPAWSPDGRSLAFVTDRFTTDLETLTWGALQLATLDVPSGAVRKIDVHALSGGQELNPAWSADGTSLTFLSDAGGSRNVYRLHLASSQLERLTMVNTGITGLGVTSPALAVATETGRFVVTLFEKGAYQLYRNAVAPDAGVPGATQAEPAGQAVSVEPSPRVRAAIRQSLASAGESLPDADEFRFRDYRVRLAPEGVAPLQAGLGVGDLGPFVTGGAAITFGDVLGHHQLTIGLESSTIGGGGRALDNLSILGGYLNQSSRWNWGLSAAQTSFPSRTILSRSTSVGGRPAFVDEELTTWETSREVSALIARPLNRARRIELAAGYQQLSFTGESRARTVLTGTGEVVADERRDLPSFQALNLATGHVAFVHDTSLFGGTSPVMGARYRMQVGVASGSVSYITALADYRRYVTLGGPFSLAGRVMHYGRYGSGSEDGRLQPFFLGYPHLVRGYEAGSFDWQECGSGNDGRCRTVERLFGSRIAVANLELRTRLGGYQGLIRSLPLPVEVAGFVDSGLAWSSRRVDEARGHTRSLVTSAGAALRVNLFGSAVAQVSYAYSWNRPREGWRWQFAVTPGF